MKKQFLLLLTCLLLVGCSTNKATSVSDKDAIVFQIGDKKITRSTLYQTMLYNNGANTVMTKIRDILLEEKIQFTEEDHAEMLADFEQLKSDFGDSFTLLVTSYGFKDEQDYYENAFVPSYRAKMLSELYIMENITKISFDLKPVKVNYAFVMQNEELAYEIAQKLNDGMSFEELALEYQNVDNLDIKLNTLFYKNMGNDSSAYEPVYTYASSVSEIGPYYNVEYDFVTDSHFVYELLANDIETFQDEFIDYYAKTDTAVFSEAFKYFLKEGKFTIFDKMLYDTFLELYADYLSQ